MPGLIRMPVSMLVMLLVPAFLQARDAPTWQPEADTIPLRDTAVVQEEFPNGYAAQQRIFSTGSVSWVKTSLLTAMPGGNVSNQLQGRAAGVTVTGSGQPGTTSNVRIRGLGSFLNNEPLYVVDGVATQDIATLNPNDVASLTVLKDAGAAAIYGSRASSGVIVITTKQGRPGLQVQYNMYLGIQQPGKGPAGELLSTEEYANLQWLVYDNDGTYETHPIYGPSDSPTPSLPAWAGDTDWFDAITDKAGIQNHDLTFSGGSDRLTFLAGLGYFRQEGIIVHTHAERYSLRFNARWSLWNNRVTIGENVTLAYRSKLGVANLSEGSPIQMGPYRSQAIIPVIMQQAVTGMTHDFVPGDYGGTGIAPRLGNSINQYASLVRAKDNHLHELRLLGSAYMDIALLEGLHFRSVFGGSWNSGYGVIYQQKTYENAENIVASSLNENSFYSGDWVWTNTLVLDRKFGEHTILAVAGYEALEYGSGRELAASRSGYYTDDVDYRTLTNGATITGANSNAYTATRMYSAFLKADYAFRDRYLLGVTVRRDGSSRFGAENRFVIYPAFSAGWRISEESFMNGLTWISALKIRGSYGITGNQFALSPMNAYFVFDSDVTMSYYDLNGTGNSAVPGYYPVSIGNPDLEPERSSMTNIGFEASLWNLGIVFDWYTEQNEQLLFNPMLPGTSGGLEPPYVNIAAMHNSGIEMELNYGKTWGDFGLTGSLLLTRYRNEIKKVVGYSNTWQPDYFYAGGTRIGPVARNEAGHPLSSFYGLEIMGLFRNDEEVANAPMQDGAEPGFFRYVNHSTDDWDEISYEDRVFIGNPHPDFTYGIDLGLRFKCFDLSAFFYGSKGNDIFNYNRWWTDFWPSFQGQKSHDLLYNSWTGSNTDATVPKASNKSNFSTNMTINSYYVEDGSYLRLKNLQLGFTVPESKISKLRISSLRVYVMAVNLFTITGYSGLDPEIGGDDQAFGIDSGNYPSAKQFLFGLKVSL